MIVEPIIIFQRRERKKEQKEK